MHTQAHRRTKTIFSAGRAAEVISSRGGSPRPRPARPRRAPCGPQGRLLALLAPRGQVCAPPPFESGGHLSVTEPEIRASEREEKARRKVFRVQINSQGGELTLMWREPFFREF